MGKRGPCCHCGITSTPLWRNGPPEKPVLCNACGSRWRTKGSLANYTPMHVRDATDPAEYRIPKVKVVSFKHKEEKLTKLKHTEYAAQKEHKMLYSGQNFRRFPEVDTSNKSSSESVLSCSESCVQFGTAEAGDVSGPAQSNVLGSVMPPKKKACVPRPKPSRVEKFAKELYSIWHEQQASNRSTVQEDLLYDIPIPSGSFEIGNGSVILRYPDHKSVEEESEASSLPTDNKQYMTYETYSASTSFPVRRENRGILSAAPTGRHKKYIVNVTPEHATRDKSSSDKLHILRDKDSPLGFTDMKDVANFEVFMTHMTHEEQHKLMIYLPSLDTSKSPESLRSMFESSQFVESLSYFQKLLQDGIFDLSNSNADKYDLLRRRVLEDVTRSPWAEPYKNFKDVTCKNVIGQKEVAIGRNVLGQSSLATLKRPRQIQNITGSRGTMRSPKRATKSGGSDTTESDDMDDEDSSFPCNTSFTSGNDRVSASSFSIRKPETSEVV